MAAESLRSVVTALCDLEEALAKRNEVAALFAIGEVFRAGSQR